MIGFADWGMRRELAVLWQTAFHDPERIPRYFLNNIFSPGRCLVCRTAGGKLTSAFYLLPARIFAGQKIFGAHYVFAAATFPEFRSRGYMTSLLTYAALTAPGRGECFSAVVPAGKPLFGYYRANGYSDFFKVRLLTVPDGRLRRIAEGIPYGGKTLADPKKLNTLRNRCLRGCGGSLLWDSRMFYLACELSKTYGDRLVSVCSGGISAYALCRAEGEECAVLEAMAGKKSFPVLAAAILREMPAKTYRFRLPAGCGLFPGEGETVPFGMIRPLGGSLLSEVNPHFPYLGLAMD